jgi:hypothetical protein
MRMLNFPDADPAVKYLNSKGIAAFILKYRVVPSTAPAAGAPPAGPRPSPMAQRNELTLKEILSRSGNANPAPGDEEQRKIINMAIADGQQAIRLLRRNAAEYHIDPKRIGIQRVLTDHRINAVLIKNRRGDLLVRADILAIVIVSFLLAFIAVPIITRLAV